MKNEKLEEALSLVTMEMLKSLEYGEEIELNDKYTLYHYTEDDCIVINETEEWEELFAVLYNEEAGEIIFEAL